MCTIAYYCCKVYYICRPADISDLKIERKLGGAETSNSGMLLSRIFTADMRKKLVLLSKLGLEQNSPAKLRKTLVPYPS